MRLGAVTGFLVFLLVPLYAQECPAIERVLPNATLSGSLDANNCQLTDGSAYMAYRLDLPVRGHIQIDLGRAKANLALILRDASGAKVESGAAIHRPIEAGSYLLLANGQTATDLGPYTITTTFTAEPGMLCANFPAIGRRQTVNGVFVPSGCIAPDGSFYEAYTLTTDGAGTLTITVASPDFTPLLALRSSDGRLLSSSTTGTLSAPVGGDSQYIVVVTSADKTGSYQIATDFQSGDDETCRPQKVITDPTSETGAITAASCYVTLPGSGDQRYYNYYELALASPGQVDLAAVSEDFTITLNLLDAGGNILMSDSGGGGLRAQLPAGEYRLQVSSDLPSGGNYSLLYNFTATNPQPCVPTAATPGDLLAGGLYSRSCRTSLGLSDLYRITVPAAGTLELDLSSSDFHTRLALRDLKDNLIVLHDFHLAADLPAGSYTIVTSAASGAGNYRATTKFSGHDIPPCTFAPALDLNGGYIQRLGPNSCHGADGQPVDYYTFTLSVDSLVLAVMTSSQVDGYLTLYNSSGNMVRADDNSYGSGDPLIIQYLPAGTYKLAARDASAGAGGIYQVDLRTVEGPRPAFCNSRGPIAPGGSVTGKITYTGCQYLDGTFADIYALTLSADTAIELRVTATEFDAYLILLDAKGNVVEEDDNSGGGANPRIAQTLAAGTYYVVVKPVGDYRQNGTYSLAAKTIN